VPESLDVPNHPLPNPLPEYRERRLSRRTLVALFAILFLAAGVRIYDLARHPLWLDEYFSLLHSAGRGHNRLKHGASGVQTPPPDLLGLHSRAPYPEIWRGMVAAPDVHPPLFQICLRIWRDALGPIFGEGDAFIRSLAVIFGVASVAMMFDVVRLLHGVRPALWAALIMALATPQLHWAQDARPYTLLFTLLLGAIDAVVRLERFGPGKRRVIALALCTFAAGLTHYYGLPALAALGVYAAIRLRGAARVQAGTALLGGVALFAIVWGPSLLVELRTAPSEASFLPDTTTPGHLARTLLRVALLPQRSLNEPSSQVIAVACLGAVLYVLPLLMSRRRPDLLIWWFWMAGALAAPLGLDLMHGWRQLEFLRYASVVILAFYPLIATALDGVRRPWLRHVLPAAAVMSCIISLPRAYAETETPKPEFPYLAQSLKAEAHPGDDVILFYHPYDGGYPLLWYMGLSWYARDAMPHTAVFVMGPPDERACEVIRRARTVWSVALATDPPLGDALAGRVRSRQTIGFNLPLVEKWDWPTTTSAPTTAP